MPRITPLAAAAAAVVITLAATSMTSRAAGSYADDRSEIEDLQARYLFALDRDEWAFNGTSNPAW